MLRISFLFLFFLHCTANAKSWNFDSGAAFGLGFKGIAAKAPGTNLIDSASANQSFSRGFSFEPFFDFGNLVVRLVAQGYLPPKYKTSGTTGAFYDTADFYLIQYGVHLQFCPIVSNDNRRRFFVKAGYSTSTLKGENVRIYTTGRSYQEKYSGTGSEILGAAGFEFFLVQNYSMSIEGGYTVAQVSQLGYVEGTDLTGVEQQKGKALLTTGGTNRNVNYGAPFVGIGLNLNF